MSVTSARQQMSEVCSHVLRGINPAADICKTIRRITAPASPPVSYYSRGKDARERGKQRAHWSFIRKGSNKFMQQSQGHHHHHRRHHHHHQFAFLLVKHHFSPYRSREKFIQTESLKKPPLNLYVSFTLEKKQLIIFPLLKMLKTKLSSRTHFH